jgi:hypothetical protein
MLVTKSCSIATPAKFGCFQERYDLPGDSIPGIV